MKYKGIELKEITKQQIFDPPKELLVWNDTYLTEPKKALVCAIIKLENYYAAIEKGKVPSYQWQHCAEIPDEPKPRRATYREMSMWLAQGKGELTYEGVDTNVYTGLTYTIDNPNTEIGSVVKIRKWEDTEWNEPTVDYMGIDDIQVSDTKSIDRYCRSL